MPIFRAWVSTCRYLLRRAATPTVRRSATGSPCRQFVTNRHDCASGSRAPVAGTALGEAVAQRVGVDEVRERRLAVDLDDGQQLPVARLERRLAGDVDDIELDPRVAADLLQNLERAYAEAAAGSGVERDPVCGQSPPSVTDRGRASSSPRRPAGRRFRTTPCGGSWRGARASATPPRKRARRCRGASRRPRPRARSTPAAPAPTRSTRRRRHRVREHVPEDDDAAVLEDRVGCRRDRPVRPLADDRALTLVGVRLGPRPARGRTARRCRTGSSIELLVRHRLGVRVAGRASPCSCLSREGSGMSSPGGVVDATARVGHADDLRAFLRVEHPRRFDHVSEALDRDSGTAPALCPCFEERKP